MSDGIHWGSLVWGVFPLSCWHSVFWLYYFRLRDRCRWNKVDIVRCVPHIVGRFFFSQASKTLFALSQFHFSFWGCHLCGNGCCWCRGNNYLRRYNNCLDWLFGCFSLSNGGESDTSNFNTGCNLRCGCCFRRGGNFLDNRLFCK